MPKPGEPGSETWQGKDIEHGGAPTWFTGSYDPALDLVYWPTGNPSKEYNGDDRKGDNLYANCILALDRKTGKLRWSLPVHAARSVGLGRDADLGARRCRLGGAAAAADAARLPQRVLLRVRSRRRQAAAGEAVRQEPDLGERHRRRRPPDQAAEPGSDAGRHEGLSVAGWRDQLVLSLVTIRRPACTTCRRSRSAASTRRPSRARGRAARRISADRRRPPTIRSRSASSARSTSAPARSSGSCRSPVPALSWGGTLTTASGLVIFGEEGGALMAADAVTGAPLWSFQTNQTWKASPMTYMFDGRQYIAVAAGANIIALATPPTDMRIWLIVARHAESARGHRSSRRRSSRTPASARRSTCPTRNTGYYRGTRFDWSGAIASLTWNGHEYFGQWFDRYDPKIHDAITGPVEEFLTGRFRARLRRGEAGRELRPNRRRRRAQAGGTGLPPVRDLRDRRSRQVDGQEGVGLGSSSCTSWATRPAMPTSIARRCGW